MSRRALAIFLGCFAVATVSRGQGAKPPCIVSPFSDRPVAMQAIDGAYTEVQRLTGVLHLGRTKYGDHFINLSVDEDFSPMFTKINTNLCSRLAPGPNLDLIRKSLVMGGAPNAAHVTWAFEDLWFDPVTREETITDIDYLDDHGEIIASTLNGWSGGPTTLRPGESGYHQDVANFLFKYKADQREHLALLYGDQQ